MSENKHTPAPWSVHQSSQGMLTVKQKEDNTIAAVGYPDTEKTDIERYGSTDANAQLIAAAPDLLEALIEVEQMIHAQEANQGTMEIVRQAINKAIGE